MQAAQLSRFDRTVAKLLDAMNQPGAEFPDVVARVATESGYEASTLTDAYDQACAGAAPLTAAEHAEADRIVRTHTAFASFQELLDAAGNYFPSLHCSSRNTHVDERADLRALANLYDRAQAARGDDRRAYRY